jgi:LDH2 family malate/lactate/ureidoglycolate dehydrogenase
MLPMGGPKGSSALSSMMDVFSGVLSGSASAGHVINPYDPSKQADVGHFLVALKPDLFMSLREFKDRLYTRVVGSEKVNPGSPVFRPWVPNPENPWVAGSTHGFSPPHPLGLAAAERA